MAGTSGRVASTNVCNLEIPSSELIQIPVGRSRLATVGMLEKNGKVDRLQSVLGIIS